MFGQMLRSPLGLISKYATTFEENPGLTASGHNSLTESEYQELCVWIVFVGRPFHLVQIVNSDHLT
jgi:hypothetical protein